VALGKVLSGKITQYDKIQHYPSEIEAMVKSIQMHDDDVKESISPARVGLSLKNIKHDEITRGDVLSNDPTIKTVTEITIDFKQNQFFKATLAENQMCLVSVGLQIKAAKFASVFPMKLTFEKPVIVMPGDVCVLLKPESNTVRIIGSGIPQ
jgi:selenocysteine-specific translation elongation factor